MHSQTRAASTATDGEVGPAAAQRAHSHLFVEARGYLQPAVDFFSRAVSVAEQKESLTGKLLASVSSHSFNGRKTVIIRPPSFPNTKE